MNKVYVYKSKDNRIAIYRDGYRGVSVQLLRVAKTGTPEGNMVDSEHVVSQVLVSANLPESLEDNRSFKDRVQAAIQQVKITLSEIQSNDAKIDGALNDYLSANKGLNE